MRGTAIFEDSSRRFCVSAESRKNMCVVASNSASSNSVHIDVESLWSFAHFFRGFPLEREEVQTLRCAISSRTRAVDGISLNLILGVPRENERSTFCFDHTSHHIEVEF